MDVPNSEMVVNEKEESVQVLRQRKEKWIHTQSAKLQLSGKGCLCFNLFNSLTSSGIGEDTFALFFVGIALLCIHCYVSVAMRPVLWQK